MIRTPDDSGSSPVPVLEIGGTHVTAALVDLGAGRVLEPRRSELDSQGARQDILDVLIRAAGVLGARERWGVAIPGPFDYEGGTGSFTGVGKFGALAGLDLGAALSSALPGGPDVVFVNDADAFGLGEAAAGAARGHRRSVGITLGTGVGSAFVADGAAVNHGPDVPPDGSAHLVRWEGRGLEETVSRRAIRDRYETRTGRRPDVREIATLARAGEPDAVAVLEEAFVVLGRAMAPWVRRFRPGVVVVGGSIAGSFDLVAGPLRHGLALAEPTLAVPVREAMHPHAALVGAACHAMGVGPTCSVRT